MIKARLTLFLCLFFAGGFHSLFAQAQFNMSDTTVTLCQGVFLDSDNGVGGDYDHNENLTFTICPPGGVDSIALDWVSFSTEADYDSIRIFLGQDTLGPLIGGPYSGSTLPPTLTVPGCITINFQTDANVAGSGWIATWSTYQTIPTAANMTLNPAMPTCSTNAMVVTFDQPIHCDSINGGNFALTGPLGQTITATAINCVNDSATQAQLSFAPGLNETGAYQLAFTTFYLDACDSLWELTSFANFDITDCPLAVEIEANPDTICPGECTELTAMASGGSGTGYIYAWSNGLPATEGPHTVCPTVTTTYYVTLTDGTPIPPAIDSIVIEVTAPPVTQPDFNICQSAAPVTLTATPPGGTWSGPGIVDSLAGTFNPDSAGAGLIVVYYQALFGCSDSVNITVDAFDAGPAEAACPGTPPFMVSGFTPAGGTWSGPNITAGGMFNPATPGSYTVTYTNGVCTDTKIINVQDITLPLDTSYCSAAPNDTLVPIPFGGTWSAPGSAIFDNTYLGIIDPSDANLGVNTLYYDINGCRDSMTVTIFEINAGANESACPKEAPFQVIAGMPAGGIWSGPGILDSITGLFDPGLQNNNWTATLIYTDTVTGCSDEKLVLVRATTVTPDTLFYCRDDSNLVTFDYALTGRSPGGGTWSGLFLPPTGGNPTIRPSDHPVGFHPYYYSQNGCSDSLIIAIRPPNSLAPTDSVCEFEPGFALQVFPADHPAGGTWSGNGVTSPTGFFEPDSAGVGTWDIYYETYYGCRDTAQITVIPPPMPMIAGLNLTYCYTDSLFPLTLTPAGGLLTGTGVVGNEFGPALAGPGTHQISYTYGQGACQRTNVAFTTVGLPLQMTLTADDDTICAGERVNLTAQAFGGTNFGYTFNWNQGLSGSFSHSVQPTQTTTYIVVVGDTCSDPQTDSVTIFVRQPFGVSFDTSAIQCYGETGWAVALPNVPGNYTYEWDVTPPVFTDTLFGDVTSTYQVMVTDLTTGCTRTRNVTIPGYPSIRASFSSNPDTCAIIDDPVFDLIDLSDGALLGLWDFGDGTFEPYTLGLNPRHRYNEVGTYTIMLAIENIGQCTDTVYNEVCVVPADVRIYNTFSPNGDGVNDYFEVDHLDAYPENSLKVYNRYGNLIYQASPYLNNWDGRSNNGADLPDGAYYYIFDKGNATDVKKGDVVILR